MTSRREFIKLMGIGCSGLFGLKGINTKSPNSGLPNNEFPGISRQVSENKIRLSYPKSTYGSEEIELTIQKDKYLKESNLHEMTWDIVPRINDSKWIRDLTDQMSVEIGSDYREFIDFVQSDIEYRLDNKSIGTRDYHQHPVETLVRGTGDCEDMTMLMYGFLRSLGIDVGYVMVPEHIAPIVGIESIDTSPQVFTSLHGKEYCFLESTARLEIGRGYYDEEDINFTYHPDHGYDLKDTGEIGDSILTELLKL